MKNKLFNIYKQRIICKFEARVLDTSISLIVFSIAKFTQKSEANAAKACFKVNRLLIILVILLFPD